MFSIVPNLITQLKTLLLTFIVAELKAELIVAAAERKAELLRQADRHEQDNLPNLAEQLRNQAEGMVPDKLLGSAAAAFVHLRADQALSKSADANASLAPSALPSAESPSPTRRKIVPDLRVALGRHVGIVLGSLCRRRNGRKPNNGKPDAAARPATPAQIKAIFGMAKRERVNLRAFIRSRCGVERPDELSLEQASELIDALKSAKETAARST